SAGFIGSGRPASELAQLVAARRELDLAGHVSRLLDPEELRSTDLIVVMNTAQRSQVCRLSGRAPQDVVLLGDLDPEPIDRRTVQEPIGRSEAEFEDVIDRIVRWVRDLAAIVKRADSSNKGLVDDGCRRLESDPVRSALRRLRV